MAMTWMTSTATSALIALLSPAAWQPRSPLLARWPLEQCQLVASRLALPPWLGMVQATVLQAKWQVQQWVVLEQELPVQA